MSFFGGEGRRIQIFSCGCCCFCLCRTPQLKKAWGRVCVRAYSCAPSPALDSKAKSVPSPSLPPTSAYSMLRNVPKPVLQSMDRIVRGCWLCCVGVAVVVNGRVVGENPHTRTTLLPPQLPAAADRHRRFPATPLRWRPAASAAATPSRCRCLLPVDPWAG